jgi:hypothetical protein
MAISKGDTGAMPGVLSEDSGPLQEEMRKEKD